MGGSASKQKSEAVTKLVQASLTGETAGVEIVLSESLCGVNDVDSGGNHALSAAVCGGHHVLCQLLLDRGAPAELKNGMGCSPLWLAAGYGHLEILDLLLGAMDEDAAKRGVDTANCTGDTALLAATSRGHAAIVARLLERGANPNLANKAGDYPLLIAAGNGDTALVSALVAGGADPSAANAKRLTPLHSAAAVQGGADPQIISLLLNSGAPRAAKDLNGATPLAIAAHCGATAAVGALCSSEEMEIADSDGHTPLWVAAAGGKLRQSKPSLMRGRVQKAAEIAIGSLQRKLPAKTDMRRWRRRLQTTKDRQNELRGNHGMPLIGEDCSYCEKPNT